MRLSIYQLAKVINGVSVISLNKNRSCLSIFNIIYPHNK